MPPLTSWRGPRFTRLQTRLTVLYTAMFAAVLLLMAAAFSVVVSANVKRNLAAELASAGATFGRIGALQTERLSQGADLLAQDYGFRQAFATGDAATTASALANLSQRLHVDGAFVLRPDGSSAAGAPPGAIDLPGLAGRLDPYAPASGVVVIGGKPFMAVAAPVLTPDPQGWVVFTLAMGRPDLAALEKTASIPLHARIETGEPAATADPQLRAILQAAYAGRVSQPARVGASLVLARPLARLDAPHPVALTLSYPLVDAAAPYRRILDIVALAAVAGAVLLGVGGWIVARGVTRPVRALDAAAQALGRGQLTAVEVKGRDELARLSASFNGMAETIRDREAHITRLASCDAEIGLGNRYAFERTVGDLLANWTAHVVVAEVRIDRFAKIRAAIGHALSLELIGAVGARLQAAGFKDVARLTTSTLGVSFACADAKEAEAVLAGVFASLRNAVRVASSSVDVAITVGFALSPEDGTTPERLLERAAIALEQATASSRQLGGFDAKRYGDPARNLSLMSELRDAIGDPQLTLAYQPKYDLREGRVTGVEALSRWTHPKRGAIAPDLFIGMAEETGHIREITDWALAQALEDQARLAASGRELEMSVNLSGRLLGDDAFITRALEMLERRRGRACLEITETAVIDDPVASSRNIQRLADAGVGVSIDDYGSGLSSLAYLREIAAHELKIDKAFVMRMDQDAKSALLVRSTIGMAHALGLTVTAEGVETAAVQALLAGMGCDLAQGYFIARPMSLAKLEAFLARPPARARA